MRYLLALALLVTSYSSWAARFVCRGDNASRPVIYSHGEMGIVLNDFYEYWRWRSKPEPLTEKDPGGTYRLIMGQENIILEYIQDTVLVAYKNSAGKIVRDIPKEFARVRRYHAVFPSFNEYVFDKDGATLTISNSLMYPPRKIIEQKFDPKGRPQLVRVVPREEASAIFPIPRPTVGHYPHCTPESNNIFKKMERFFRLFF